LETNLIEEVLVIVTDLNFTLCDEHDFLGVGPLFLQDHFAFNELGFQQPKQPQHQLFERFTFSIAVGLLEQELLKNSVREARREDTSELLEKSLVALRLENGFLNVEEVLEKKVCIDLGLDPFRQLL